MPRQRFSESNVLVAHEPNGLAPGQSCVAVTFCAVGNLTLRMTLTDAEQLAEAIVQCVRRAEESAS